MMQSKFSRPAERTNTITLNGSTGIVIDYLFHAINSIVYQRGLYSPEMFSTVHHYGIPVLVLQDDNVKAYLNTVLGQIKVWLNERIVKDIGLVIFKGVSQDAVETWNFHIKYENGHSTIQNGLDKTVLTSNENVPKKRNAPLPETGSKDLKEIQNEIRDVMRQICSTVSFLPLLEGSFAFDLTCTTTGEFELPSSWGEAVNINMSDFQKVRFKPFSTSLHRCETAVNYKISK